MSGVPFAPNASVPNPGININIGPQSISALSQPNAGVSWLPNVGDSGFGSVARAMQFGNPQDNEVTTFFPSNEPMNYGYVLMPWNDESENLITEGVCVFASRYIDRKFNTINAVSLGKLNQLMKIRHASFKARANNQPGSEESEFQNWLNSNDESLLREYDILLRTNREMAEEMSATFVGLAEAHKRAQRDSCLYESLFGILKMWNFVGVCTSLGHSTGSGDYLDSHDYTQKVHSVGITVARRARVHNVWPDAGGQIRTGAKLFFVIRRSMGRKDEPFQIEPLVSHHREYPQSGDVTYKGHNNRTQRGYVIHVGFVSEKSMHVSDREKQSVAIGTNAMNAIDAHRATVSLPQIVIQLKV